MTGSSTLEKVVDFQKRAEVRDLAAHDAARSRPARGASLGLLPGEHHEHVLERGRAPDGVRRARRRRWPSRSPRSRSPGRPGAPLRPCASAFARTSASRSGGAVDLGRLAAGVLERSGRQGGRGR